MKSTDGQHARYLWNRIQDGMPDEGVYVDVVAEGQPPERGCFLSAALVEVKHCAFEDGRGWHTRRNKILPLEDVTHWREDPDLPF